MLTTNESDRFAITESYVQHLICVTPLFEVCEVGRTALSVGSLYPDGQIFWVFF